MIKRLLVLLLVVYGHIQAQNTVGTISITEDAYDAFTLFTVNTKVYLINNCGEVINEWNSNYLPGNAVYLLPNGNILRAGRLNDGSSNIGFGGQGGIVELFDWDDNLLWSYTYSSNQFRQHHDVFPMPNGNVLILAATVVSDTDAIQAGRNPAFLPDNELYNEQILEVQPVGATGGNIVWEWNAIDHLIQDFDNTKNNFGVVADNPQKIDVNYLNGFSGGNNWLHINSMQYDAERDQIVLSSRNLSELWIIDHSTTTAQAATGAGGTYGRGGDLLYRWGNPEAYDQGTPVNRQLFGQHYPYIIPSGLPNAGKIIAFNNGFGRTPLFSEVDIIDPPISSPGVYTYTPGTPYGPATTDFTYSDLSTDPSEFYSAIVSSAQQLSNGNILVCEGRDGVFFEIDPSNSNAIVWKYINPVSNADGSQYEQTNPPPINNLTFRAVKYGMDYPAFDGRDLTPGLPLEINPDLTPCNNLSIDDFEISSLNIYPNPVNDFVTIDSTSPLDRIEVYNMLGAKVNETNSSTVDFREMNPGIYFLRVHSNSQSISKKIIKR
ncbi:MAG: aryl-sulfate sulfotransferase [Bacteroidota bacterium]